MTVKVLTPDDPDIFSEAVALATSYDLPNNTRALGLWPQEKEEASKLSRRQRSYVYSKAESILSNADTLFLLKLTLISKLSLISKLTLISKLSLITKLTLNSKLT
ncbi:unnamed protein product [Nesidiocoris tenuis]|uniref:Uncharacterized protein n=1 Tax=Nesidiocoris tenuis TaxID=355587 RepID=A0A6H5HET0_9HEMI|nr:unnamed protein product [Nesidiocoris tenuis]